MNEGSAQNRLVGYARVSTTGQTLDGQLAQLKAAGCDPIFKDTAGGALVDRKELQRMLAKLEPGDAVTVTRIDRLVRSFFDLFAIVQRINDSGAVPSIAEPWADTGTSTGRMMLAVMAGMADAERDLIRTRRRKAEPGRPPEASTWAARRGSRRNRSARPWSAEKLARPWPRSAAATTSTGDHHEAQTMTGFEIAGAVLKPVY
ncbi:recombinase family protein [Bradyrhizobium sp. CCBAU 11430]|uniref:recombinase family protein n=1 Tax=Bradyrhizobium sp. CCBAU 11430 TaxID=1630881 RepID=UPI00230545FE|nr:recombinase family protein [Bradyrhizobium sp. CCBAU 11430]